MNYMAIIKSSCVDYEGWSTVLQVSGCAHMCGGCFNKTSWSSAAGQVFTDDTYKELVLAASKPYIDNICLQGGDPLFKRNVGFIIELCRKLKYDLPDKKIVMWTGYNIQDVYRDIERSKILDHIDVLIDGKYRKELPTSKPFRGSRNQVLHIIENGKSVKQL